MNQINQYQELAMRTCATKEFNETLKMTSVGMMDELAELLEEIDGNANPQKIRKELGDVCWYIAVATYTCSIELHTIFPDYISTMPKTYRQTEIATIEAIVEAGKVTGHLKKHLWHGHALSIIEIQRHLKPVMMCLQIIAHNVDTSLQHIMFENIQKLQERYPDGFSQEKSINRQA